MIDLDPGRPRAAHELLVRLLAEQRSADAVLSEEGSADGTPLEYNRDDVLLPDLIVCRPELAEQIISDASHWVSHAQA